MHSLPIYAVIKNTASLVHSCHSTRGQVSGKDVHNYLGLRRHAQVLKRPVDKVSRILPDLRSGAQKFYYREIRDPIIYINNASGDNSRVSQGP